ncbi:hypothetical protein CYMTET_15871 [Cymbomonas tetramitiformis]|uniref:Ammonium transporter n=1 Tax=Cymbomonas tetramitiformis TaxID=36881 RepID=A0AAE0L8V3_9CHLO|nr:hypothetical protein CYMTET_15871 [Cymbomonas tetramitiformis]
MQIGFALLEAGTVRAKNTKNILLKSIIITSVVGLTFWAFGYSFAYGEGGASPNSFMGGTNFFMSSDKEAKGSFYAKWMYQWAIAAVATTIVSGAMAERCRFAAYLIYATVISGFIYPVVVHWGWSSEGWLSPFRQADDDEGYEPELGANGFIDFAGSGIVHMVGGGAALVGSIFLGARSGRFRSDGTVVELASHSTIFSALGAMILWFGWYGFCTVHTLAITKMEIASKVAVTTTLSACAGACTTTLIHVATGSAVDVIPTLNGLLAGLVAISGPCVVVEPYAAAIIGLIAGCICYSSSTLLRNLQIDDPLDAAPIHFFCGAWGCIATGFFATATNTRNAYGTSEDDYGAFYNGGGKQLGIQLVGTLAIASWTCGTSGLLFLGLSQARILRISFEDEIASMDENEGNLSGKELVEA